MLQLMRRSFTTGSAALSLLAGGGISKAAEPDYGFVDPALLAAAGPMIRSFGAAGDFTQASLAASRVEMMKHVPASLRTVPCERRSIAGPPGSPPVVVYVINARAGAHRPGILHTHGGGFIMGSPLFDIPRLQRMAQQLGCAIVTVDYRLAPETGYAGSLDDNYAGLLWLHQNAAMLGVDRGRLAVLGESAGGGHAALLALRARDRGEVKLAFQALIYPMLDDRTGSTRFPPAPIGTIGWNAARNRFGWAAFLGQTPGGPRVPAEAVPARATNLAGLPPAFIGVGSIDLFVDEDIGYANRLIDAHVATELVVVPGAFHGFDGMAPSVPISRFFNAAKIDALRRGLAS